MDHSNCSHPRTKAGRAACRRSQGKPARSRPEGQAGKAKKVKNTKRERYSPEDVVAAEHSNGELRIASAQYVWEHQEEFSADEIRNARQYLFGS